MWRLIVPQRCGPLEPCQSTQGSITAHQRGFKTAWSLTVCWKISEGHTPAGLEGGCRQAIKRSFRWGEVGSTCLGSRTACRCLWQLQAFAETLKEEWKGISIKFLFFWWASCLFYCPQTGDLSLAKNFFSIYIKVVISFCSTYSITRKPITYPDPDPEELSYLLGY